MLKLSCFFRLTAICAALFLPAQLVANAPAQAQTVADVAKALAVIPAMNNIAVSDVKQSGAFFTAKLGSKKQAATIFNLGTKAKPVWNIALYPATLKLSQVYKSGGGAPLGGIVVSNPAVVIASGTGSGDLAKLPAPVQAGIKKVFGTAIKKVTFPGGVNFSFTVDLARTKAMNLVRTTLGVSSAKVPMAGQIGADLVRYLANGNAATQPADLAGVSLTAVLGTGKPPNGASYVSVQATSVMYRGDAKGQITPHGQSTLNITAGKSVRPFKADIVFGGRAERVSLQLTEKLTVRDVFGETGTGIDPLPFKAPVVNQDHIVGSISFRGVETPVVMLRPQNKKPVLALLHKTFATTAYLPALTGSTLDNAVMQDVAMIVVPKSASLGAVASKDLAGPLGAMVQAAIGATAKFALHEGVNLVGAIDVTKSAALKRALGFAGIKQAAVPFAARISVDVLKNPTQPGAAGLKADAARIRASLDLSAAVSPPKLPGLSKVLTIPKPSLRIVGLPDASGKAVTVTTSIEGNMQLALPGRKLTLLGTVTLNSDPAKGLEFKGTSQLDWPSAFGVSFVNMSHIGFTGSSKTDAKGKQAISLILNSGVRIGAARVQGQTKLVLANGEIADFELGLPEGVKIGGLPVFNTIPGINDLAFRHVKISGLGVYGEVVWKPLNLTTQFAIVRARDGQLGAIIRVKDVTLGTLSKDIPEPFASLKLPTTAMTFAAKNMLGLTRQTLPPGIQPILDGIVDRPDGRLPISEGINIIAAVGERDFPKPLHKIVKDIGVFDALDGPLILAGKIPDHRVGKKQITLYASLPALNLPKNQPLGRIVSFDQTQADFFIRGNPLAQVFQVGAAGNLTVSVPHLDDPKKVDKLRFRGEVYANIDPVSPAGSFKVAGTMQGKWRNPLGLNNFAFENPAFLVGFDGEAAVEFGIGGNMEFAARNKQKLSYGADFLLNLNFSSTIPAPKKLGVRFKMSKSSPIALLEIGDALMRGVLTGPMASAVTLALPADARKAVQKFQADMKKGSLLDLMKVDQLPIPLVQYRDIDLYFATPGAYIPGREKTLNGIGMVVAGKAELTMMGKVHRLAEVDTRLTLLEGLKIYGKLPAISLGPLKLGPSVVDIAATFDAPPHFKIRGSSYLLGTSEVLDINLSKDKIAFFYDRNLGPVIKLRVDAKTIGKDLLGSRDFTVNVSTTTDIDKVITGTVLPQLGIPKAVAEIIRKSNPLFIRGGTFTGSLTEFVNGSDVVLTIDHDYFGQKMEPAVAKFKPVWKDPASAFPALKIAHAMTISFAKYLAAHPVKLANVDLGLLKYTDAVLKGVVDPKQKAVTQFVIGGKANFLGASRQISATLSDASYSFQLKDKIAGGIWDSDLRAWTSGGTALAPADLKYYGTLSADFYTWLQKSVGRELDKNYGNVGSLYKKAQADLAAAEARVRGIDALIAAKRTEARKEIGALANALVQAIKALDHTKWLRGLAYDKYVAAEKTLASHHRVWWYPGKDFVILGMTGYKELTRNAFNVAELAYKAAQAIVAQLRKKPSQISIDLHPKVAPLIVARTVALGVLQGVRGAFAAAEAMNNQFKKITNDLINAVAGSKVLVIRKAVYTGSVKEATADLHLNLDVLNTKNLFMRIKVNLLKPQETDLRALALSVMAVIKGQQIASAAKALPPPPKLVPETVPKIEIVNAVVAEIKAKAAAAAWAPMNAAVNWGNGKTYMFNGANYSRYDIPSGRLDGASTPVTATNWNGLPFTTVDAAVNWGNGFAYLFSGEFYTSFDIKNNRADTTRRRLDSGSWRGLTFKKIDAAVNFHNDTVFLFSGENYVAYSVRQDKVISSSRRIFGDWRGVPFKTIDAAVYLENKKVYLVSGNQYVVYDVATNNTDGPPLPLTPENMARWRVAGAGQAAAPPLVNLAKGRPARQSTVAVGGVAGRAVDGNTDGNWNNGSVTHTTDQMQAWWQVDLGKSHQIDTVRIHNRTDCCAARLNNAVVMISDKPFTGTQLNARAGDGIHRTALGVAQPVNTIKVGRTGRYVLIQLPGKNPLSLAEVEVMGR